MNTYQPDSKDMKRILEQSKTIAVVGLSSNPERTSYQIAKVMQDVGYDIIPVNPSVDHVLGVDAVPSINDIEQEIEIINVFRRSEFLPEIVRRVAESKHDNVAIWAQLGVYSEEAATIAEKAGITLIMDRCIKVEHARLIGH